MTRPFRPSSPPAGFTLIETMVALALLAIALVGAMAALVGASGQLRDGQIRQYRSELVDASVQRALLSSKENTAALATSSKSLATACASDCGTQAIGGWPVDPSAAVGNDLGTGAYFAVTSDGQVKRLAVAAGTACGDAALPGGSFCREVLVTRSPAPMVGGGTGWKGSWPPVAPSILANPANATLYTVWVRVSRKGDSLSQAVYSTTTFVQ